MTSVSPLSGKPPPRFTALTAADIEKLPDAHWLVRDVLPAEGIACVYGASQAGKSALALHLARALSVGEPWFGIEIEEKFRVVYVLLEGAGGLKSRIRVISPDVTPGPMHSIQFVKDPFRINDPTNVAELAKTIMDVGGADLTIIDTLNCAAPDADENSSRDMGLILAGAKELQRVVGGLVVLVHHVGKDATRGMRGHSSLFAAIDTAIMVTRDGDWRSWTVVKSRDSEDGLRRWFTLSKAIVGEDSKGRSMTAPIIQPSDHEPSPAGAVSSLGPNQQVALKLLNEAFDAVAEQSDSDCLSPEKAGLPFDEVLGLVKSGLAVEPKRKTERAKEAINSLIAAGMFVLQGDRICPSPSDNATDPPL